MQNSMGLFIFSVLDKKHTFWANLVQKIKIFSLSWTLVPRLIRISRIHWWRFCFIWERPFLGKVGSKNENCQLKLKFSIWTNWNMENAMALFIFSALERKHLFWANLVQKIKIVSLIKNLVPRIILICRIQWCCSLFLIFCFGKEILQSVIIVSATLRGRWYRQPDFFILLRWVPPWIVFGHCLKNVK